MTSDNVSPIHLMDIKRVAFETKPVLRRRAGVPKAIQPAPSRPMPKRDQIAAIIDSFLTKKLAGVAPTQPAATAPAAETPVKTVIHELRPQSDNGSRPEPVDFVSEADVRAAVEKGAKIYITSKTILTPAARDLGNEKDVFAKA